MTGYYISTGYNSSKYAGEVSQTLFEVGRSIADDPERLMAEVERIDGYQNCREYAEAFQKREDKTIQFEHEPPTYLTDKDDWHPQIRMLASGGGTGRSIKEAFRRAFIRLVMLEMHKRQMEINVTVA